VGQPGVPSSIVRALTTLVGLAASAAILYLVTDVGDSGGSYWPIALVWAAAGLVMGLLYQGGGRRAPGLRTNIPMLIFAFLPWTVLTAALVAVVADKPRWMADRATDFLPNGWIDRWEVSLPAFAFGTGLLLAFSLIEPRVGLRVPDEAPILDATQAEISPWESPEPAVVREHREAAEAAQTDEQPVAQLPESTDTVIQNPVQVIEPHREIDDTVVENPARVVDPTREAHPDE
jgi:hypothetical protein